MKTKNRNLRLSDELWEKLNVIAKKYGTEIIELDRTELIRLFIWYCTKDESLLEKICRGKI